jgi:hypothetical protein
VIGFDTPQQGIIRRPLRLQTNTTRSRELCGGRRMRGNDDFTASEFGRALNRPPGGLPSKGGPGQALGRLPARPAPTDVAGPSAHHLAAEWLDRQQHRYGIAGNPIRGGRAPGGWCDLFAKKCLERLDKVRGLFNERSVSTLLEDHKLRIRQELLVFRRQARRDRSIKTARQDQYRHLECG